jgi:S-adenosyl-L-methionine hydrolase (adenosine-forming)
MRRPILAFLTDFGTRDPYVGAMKGAALSVCPEATLVDLGHEVPPHDVLAGARHLAATYRYFPADTVFVAVIDPGVGTARRAIAAKVGDYRFVAPDNGVLTAVLRETSPARVVELANPQYHRPSVSRTCEGRDRFAPVGAWLLRGVDLAALGPPVVAPCLLDWPSPVVRDGNLEGRILDSDRFGNLVSTLDRREVEAFVGGRPFVVEAGGRAHRLVTTYAEIDDDEVCALYGSSDWLELAARSRPAAGRPGLDRGAPVRVRPVSV